MVGGFEGVWVRRACPEEALVRLIQELAISPWVARVLVGRGVTDPETASLFLHPEDQPLHDPILLPGIDAFLLRIEKAIKNKERVVVHGDYDADGITSAAIMRFALRRVGLAPDVFLPNRFDSGYGIHPDWVEAKKEEGYQLIITTDCGSSAVETGEKAKEVGIDLIVTDHHTPNPDLPGVVAHVNPHLPGSEYPFHEICGAGVAFKLAHALSAFVPPSFQSRYREEIPVDLAMIGTLADVMPLIDENRRIVVDGLERARSSPSVGLRALLESARCAPEGINAETIAFQVAPRLNAAGRLDSPQIAFDLLVSEDPDRASEIAAELDRINNQRKKLAQKASEEALSKVKEIQPKDCVVLMEENWHRGILGIAAAKVVEATGLPVFLGALDGDSVHGSSRVPEGYHAVEILQYADEFTSKGGGHAGAAGFTVAKEDWEDFKAAIERGVEQSEKEAELPTLDLDGFLNSDRGFSQLLAEISSLEPFGAGFPVPAFSICRYQANGNFSVFSNNHLKIQIDPWEGPLEAMGFGLGDWGRDLQNGPVDISLQYGENHWNGETCLRPQILSLRPPLKEQTETYRPLQVSRITDETGKLALTVWDARNESPLESQEPIRVGYGPDWMDWWMEVLPGKNPHWKSKLWRDYRALPSKDWPGDNAIGYGGELPEEVETEIVEILWPPLRKADRDWLGSLLRLCPKNTLVRVCYSERDLEDWLRLVEAEISRETLGTVYRALSESNQLKDLFALSMTRTNVVVCLEVLSELALVEWEKEEVRLVPNPGKKDFSSAQTIEAWNRFVDSLETWRAQSLNGTVQDLVSKWMIV
ncbi:MAG: single-stranded-DNA-specific exonuclease RecJ [Candidatus Omnitrophica bacterium]|nr:single-stranded-DNA-specific exonuclease RecJ [Candidatus Omnitrophota bacterium]